MGYTEPVVDYALDALFGELDRTSIEATIVSELGSLDALDGFVPRTGRPDVRFVPREHVAIVSSASTIGVAIPALAFALCAKASVRVKDRDDALVAAFAETITSEQPELAARMQIGHWNANDETANAAFFADARVVVGYGSDATLARIRAQMDPLASLLPFGHRTSIAYVSRRDLSERASAAACARGIATDGLLYDGEGCLSVHVVFAERGAALAPQAFAALLAEACDDVAIEFPASFTGLDARAATLRASAAFRASQGVGAVHGGAIAPHLVIFDPPADAPPPWARRTLALYPVDDPSDARRYLEGHGIALEAVAANGRDTEVETFAIACGASRIAPFGTLQRPPLGGEHGGYGRILPFVRAIYRSC